MSLKPSILLLGCYHELQGKVPPQRFNPDGENYANALKQCVAGVTFIGEETDTDGTLAHGLANERKIGWANVDISTDLKKLITL